MDPPMGCPGDSRAPPRSLPIQRRANTTPGSAISSRRGACPQLSAWPWPPGAGSAPEPDCLEARIEHVDDFGSEDAVEHVAGFGYRAVERAHHVREGLDLVARDALARRNVGAGLELEGLNICAVVVLQESHGRFFNVRSRCDRGRNGQTRTGDAGDHGRELLSRGWRGTP